MAEPRMVITRDKANTIASVFEVCIRLSKLSDGEKDLAMAAANLVRYWLPSDSDEQRRAIRIEALRECAKAVYPINVDAHHAVCELIAKEEA